MKPKIGHWIGKKYIGNDEWQEYIVPLDEEGYTTDECRCSECGDTLAASDEYACRGYYCPNCGARMAENEDLKKRLKQEPSEDVISRQAVNDAINDVLVKYIPILYGNYEKIPLELITAIIQLPSVNPQPKIGYWINIIDKDLHDFRTGDKLCFECSECKSQRTYRYSFCPNCGARMESEE